MAWLYSTTDEFDTWVEKLDQEERNEIAALLDALTRLGPNLGRPVADTLNGSAYANMKELRGRTAAAVLRIAFAFDPERCAVILWGSNKRGVNERAFYRKLIAKADRLYAAHLQMLKLKNARARGTRGVGRMAKDHTEFLEKFVPAEQMGTVRRRSDAIVIGQILRMLREERKLSQSEIAYRMGLKQPAIARLEGQSDIKLSTLQEWARATGGELVLAIRRKDKVSPLLG